MAKSQYDAKVVPNLELIQKWARCGISNEEIRKNLGIGKATWYKYVKEHTELSELLKKTREVVDASVENALLKKALGYKVKVKKTFKVKHVIYENGKKVREDEKLEQAYDEVYIPPDIGAQCFWLKNRNPEEWKDKRSEVVDVEEEEVIQLTNIEEEQEDESDLEATEKTS